MLDSVTKKRIDDLRNILVGKIPSPQSQVEQITTGLIYKFMYDMDNEAIEMGGVPSFFVDEYAKYSWKHLFNPKLGGIEKVKLYSEAIENLYTNPHSPSIFREIFKNSFLPFKDPSTLNMFLKEINEFHYSNSEKLGDAYEYLLSFMGSQGDAGQFRTPRHIIDLIIKIVNPQKNETILDPACGTSGFLISSYKHILKQNSQSRLGDKLNALERKIIGDNLCGYDIDPSMSRISLVNMYLHKFTSPKIYEYDTLSSEDRWNEYFDIILANPPFFSPTGGIKPHSRFGVKSKRSEVLFVDYIIDHLKPNGRAGIIVPEGIIFQKGGAYNSLRKKLIEDCLIGVISLPAGIFKPYSGVKTSILILDKQINKEIDNILFTEVQNDGFTLTTQRTPIEKNDLPLIISEFQNFKDSKTKLSYSTIVPKTKILKNSTYSLTSSVYNLSSVNNSHYQMTTLSELVDLQNGYAFSSKDYVNKSDVMNFRMSQIRPGGSVDLEHNPKFLPKNYESKFSDYLLKENDVVIAMTDMANEPKILGVPTIIPKTELKLLMNQRVGKFIDLDKQKATYKYIGWILKSEIARNYFKSLGTGGVQINISKKQILSIDIPIPPLNTQKEVVEELEGYQKIIDGCRIIIDNYKPTFDIDESWNLLEIENIGEIISGGTPKSEEKQYWDGDIKWLTLVDLPPEDSVTIITNSKRKITNLGLSKSSAKIIPPYSVIVSTRATIGRVGINTIEVSTNQGFKSIVINDSIYLPEFIAIQIHMNKKKIQKLATGGTFGEINKTNFGKIKLYIPPINIQKRIVEVIKEEQKIVDSNKKFIEIYTQKIQKKITKIWK